MKKKSILVILSLLVLVLFAFLIYNNKINNSKSDENITMNNQLKKLKVVSMRTADDIIFMLDVARDKGFFEKYNLDVETIETAKSSTEILEANEVDLSSASSISGPMVYYFNDAETRMISNLHMSFTAFGLSRFPKGEEYKIKKVAIKQFGKGSHYRMISVLKSFGLDPDKIEIIQVREEVAREILLSKGEVDYINIGTEKLLDETNAYEKYTVYQPGEILKDAVLTRAVFATKKSLQEKPEEIKYFLVAMYDAMDYLSKNKEESIKYIAERYDFSDKKAEGFYNRFITARKNVNLVPNVEEQSELLKFVKKEYDPSNPDRDIEGFIKPELAKEALQILNEKK